MSDNHRVLIVDDNATNLAILEEALGEEFETRVASSGAECLEIAQDFEPDLVLLDVMMPEMDGYECCRRLRRQDHKKHSKIIMLSALAMARERLAGYEAGADDYLTKPFDMQELISKVQVFLRLKRVEESSLSYRQVIGELEEANGRLSEEIHRRQRAEDRLRFDSLHDVLTRLPNRAFLVNRIEQGLARARREPGWRFAVMFLDMDDFKVINDSLGHKVGDHFLIEVSRRFAASVRELDFVARAGKGIAARLGGDEFVLLLEGIADAEQALMVEARIREALAEPVHIEGHAIHPTASIGIALAGDEYTEPGDVLRDADTAMYHAKASGKGCSAVFDDGMRERAVSRMRMEQELSRALENDELYVHYQPIFKLQSGELHGFEALVRWDHPERGILPPAEFIPLAEETGLIIGLGRIVMYEACRQIADWHQRYPEHGDLTMSVNVSGAQLREKGIVEMVDEILEEFQLDSQTLQLELTETVLIESDAGDGCLVRFKERNVDVHMDDFGTGYSSLSYLSRLPIGALKLDRSFVAEMLHSEAGAATVRAVMQLAHSHDLKVIAEGIERPEQSQALKDLGCDLGQGFLYSRPIDPAVVEGLFLSSDRREQSA